MFLPLDVHMRTHPCTYDDINSTRLAGEGECSVVGVIEPSRGPCGLLSYRNESRYDKLPSFHAVNVLIVGKNHEQVREGVVALILQPQLYLKHRSLDEDANRGKQGEKTRSGGSESQGIHTREGIFKLPQTDADVLI